MLSNYRNIASIAQSWVVLFAVSWIPHRLSVDQKLNKMKLCREMLEFISDLGPKQQQNFMIGDES
jgi:hypothetical protein